jgi:hypothetical protein
MPSFSRRFYSINEQHLVDVDSFQSALLKGLDTCPNLAERPRLLHEELIEITRHITEGVRASIKQDKRIRRLVRDLGVVPLATRTDVLSLRMAITTQTWHLPS